MIGRFRRRRPEPPKVTAIPIDALHRQMLYDVTPNVRELCEIGGLAPVSDEVDAMERRDSQERMATIAYLMPLLMTQTEWMGELAVAVHLKELEADGYTVSVGDVERFSKGILDLIRTSVVGSVSTIVGLGLLEVPEEVRD